MKRLNKKDMMILAGATVLSVVAGVVVSTIKNKMMDDTYCIIEEM